MIRKSLFSTGIIPNHLSVYNELSVDRGLFCRRKGRNKYEDGCVKVTETLMSEQKEKFNDTER